MSGYDDIIRGLDTSPSSPGAVSPAGPYVDTIRDLGDATQGQARANTFVGQQSNPDTAARAKQLSDQLGIPATAIEGDLPTYEAQAQTVQNNEHLKQNPALAQWIAANPESARIAHDDFDKLGPLEKAITAAKTGFNEGGLQDSLSKIGYQQLTGDQSPELDQQEKSLRAALSTPTGIDGAFYNSVKTVSSFLGGLAEMGNFAGRTALGGAIVGSAVPGVGAGVGAGAGFVAGMVKEGFQTGAGQLYQSLRAQRDANGDPMSPDVVRGASLVGGLFLGLLNGLNMEALGKPFADAMGKVVPSLAEKLMEKPTVAAALGGFGKGLLKSGGTGLAFGALASVVTTATENIAKEFDDGKWDTVFDSEAERSKALDSLVSQSLDMALTFAVLHTPAQTVGLGADLYRAREAGRQADFFNTLADGSAASKTRERSPDAFQNFIASQTDGTPVENVHIPAEQVLKFFQTAGIDPESPEGKRMFAFQPDLAEQLKQAAPIDGDVVIKTADYAAHVAGTEADAALRPHLRTPNGISADEAKTFFQEQKAAMDEARAGEAKDLGKPEEDAETVRGKISKQLEEAGYKGQTASGMAAQMAAFFRTIGARMGVDPVSLFNRWDLKIFRPQLQMTPEGAMDQAAKDPAFQKWQGQSVEKGVMYHGTSRDIEKFNPKQAGAIYVTPDPGIAHDYASSYSMDWSNSHGITDAAPAIYPLFVRAERPFDPDNASHIDAFEKWADEKGIKDEDVAKQTASKDLAGEIPTREALTHGLERGAWGAVEHPLVQQYLREAGHDSFYQYEAAVKNLAVLDPSQIKSAFNRGDFNPNDPRILYQPAYHGSPHEFDEFKLNKIGTGEGAQAYGWGLYFASNKKVAEWYKKKLTGGSSVTNDGVNKFNDANFQFTQSLKEKFENAGLQKTIATADERRYIHQLFVDAEHGLFLGHGIDKVIDDAGREAGSAKDNGEWEIRPEIFERVRDHLEAQRGMLKQYARNPKGRLYHVDIPEHDEFLDYHKPLSEQPAGVQEKLKAAGLMEDGTSPIEAAQGRFDKWLKKNKIEWDEDPENLLGMDWHKGKTILNDAQRTELAAIVEEWDKSEKYASGEELYQHLSEDKGGAVENWWQDRLDKTEARYQELNAKSFDQMAEDEHVEYDKMLIDRESNISAEELTSKYLNSIGIPGLTYKEGSMSGGKGKNYNYVVFDDSKVKIQKYEQTDPMAMQEKRGYIQFGPERKVSIALLEKADLSTFLHESGHFYLEVLRELSTGEGGDVLADDVKKIHDFLGVKSWDEIGTAQHEKWARAFEAYLMEGKAPSRELQGAFARFSRWLSTIYQRLGALDVHLTDEVRGVMDRMLATQDEIDTARRAQRLEALFTDAKQAGMTDAEFNSYKASVRRAAAKADDTLLEKVMRNVRYSRTKTFREERAKIRTEVGAKVDARPDMRAIALLRDGKLQLDINELRKTYGSDILAQLPSGRPGGAKIAGEGGVHPDVVAEQSGFRSGDAMIKALIALQRKTDALRTKDPRATVRDTLIREAVNARMDEEHPDILNSDSIREEALNALHSERQAEVLAAELRALARQVKRPPTPVQVARKWARDTLASKQVSVAISAWKYSRDEAKAQKALEKALLAGDHQEAFKQGQLRMLNHVLYMEAKDAADRVEKGNRFLRRYADAEVVRGLDQDYLDQIHSILERFDFRQASADALAKRESLADWINRQEANGEEVKIPEKIRDLAFKKNYSKLTLDEFSGLVDSVENIVHLGRLKATLLDGAERRAFGEVVAEAVAAASHLPQAVLPDARNPGQGGKGLDRINAAWINTKHVIAGMDAALLKMEQVFQWLDSRDPLGVFNRVAFRRISEAATREVDMRRVIVKRLKALGESMPKSFFKALDVRHEIPELIDSRTEKPSSMLKSEILSLALNWGNMSSRDKMLRGEKWSESSVRAVLDRHMSKADWDWVQGTWDSIESLWPEIEAMERRMSGVAPEKIEAHPVETPHGTYKGGYYPIIYDPLRSWDIEKNRQKAADQLFENNYQRATTSHGYTIERKQQFARPLYLSLDVLPRHLDQVIHDLAFREAVMDVDRFLQAKEVRAAVEKSLGREVYQQFRPWLQAIANDRVVDERGLAFWDRAAHWARTTATMVGLGFRLTTMFIHGATAASNSVGELGPRWMLSGTRAFFGSPEKMANARDFVFERSGEMRNRMNTFDRDVRDGLRDLEGKSGPLNLARQYAYYGISMLDMASAMPTWMGAYNRGMTKGLSEADASYAADQAVRNAHGGSNVQDIAAIQRGPEFQKLFTMFYSFWSHFYNRERDMVRRGMALPQTFRDGGIKPAAKDFSMVLARSVFYFVIPQLIHSALRSRAASEEGKDWSTLAEEEVALGVFAGIPMVRDVAASFIEGKDYEATPASKIVKAALQSGKDLARSTGLSEEPLSDKWVKHSVETAGYAFGLPLGQASGTSQFLWDVMDGTADPKDLADWWHGITYGKLEN